ncbi:MAG: hypothetical protein PQJ58_20985, partial [Spirochaetales bacterium]|nr:hypothetical protein [Spirochaetales bacterium]
FDSAAGLYTNAFRISSSVDWTEGMVRSLVHLSRCSDRTGDSSTSRDYLKAAEELLFASDDPVLDVLVGNREVEWLLFNESAGSALEKCISVSQNHGSVSSSEAGETWRLMAAIYKKKGDYDSALVNIEKAVSHDDKYHYLAELASDYYIKSSIQSLSGNEADAVNSMLQALHYDKFIENTAAITQDLYALGLIYEKMGDSEMAIHYFQRTYLVYTGSGKTSVPEILQKKLEKGDNKILLPTEDDR